LRIIPSTESGINSTWPTRQREQPANRTDAHRCTVALGKWNARIRTRNSKMGPSSISLRIDVFRFSVPALLSEGMNGPIAWITFSARPPGPGIRRSAQGKRVLLHMSGKDNRRRLPLLPLAEDNRKQCTELCRAAAVIQLLQSILIRS